MVIHWSSADLADAVRDGLHARAQQDDEAQVVYGIDALDELGLHPLIHESFNAAGWGVWPEQRYPSDWGFTKRSEGKRCDVVLTPEKMPLREQQVRGTLFDTADAIDPEHAYWLEIKTVAQFESEGPAKRYSRELLSPVADDIKKLWSDPLLRHAGLLLVLFTADAEVAEHDMEAWHRRCLDRGYPVALPAVRGFRVTDRIGNGWCGIGLFDVRGV